MKRQYTFEDWLNDRLYYELKVPPSLMTTEDEFLNDVYNHPENLNFQGHLSDEEYDQIVEYQKLAYGVALAEFKKRIPAYIESKLNASYELSEITATKRLQEIEDYIRSVDGAIYDKVIQQKYPMLQASGVKCKALIETKDTTPIMGWMFLSHNRPPIESALPSYKYYPDTFLLLSMLLEERALLVMRKQQVELSEKIILDKFAEFRKHHSAPKATLMIEKWLFEELKLTPEYVQDKCEITVTVDALRQRLYRRPKTKK